MGLPQHVHHPILTLALADKCVQRPRGSPHDVGARLVVVRVLHRDAAAVDERAHQPFGQIVGRVVVRAGEVLLHDVAHDVEEACHHLPLWHGEGVARVEDGEPGHHPLAEHLAYLELRRVVGDDRATVHFRTGAHHGQHGAHGDNAQPCVRLFLPEVVLLPRVVVKPCRYAHRLGVVDGGASAYGKNQVHVVLPVPALRPRVVCRSWGWA